jgi:hypothetical protein
VLAQIITHNDQTCVEYMDNAAAAINLGRCHDSGAPRRRDRGRENGYLQRGVADIVGTGERELGLHLFPKMILVVELPNTNNWTN